MFDDAIQWVSGFTRFCLEGKINFCRLGRDLDGISNISIFLVFPCDATLFFLLAFIVTEGFDLFWTKDSKDR